MGILQRVYKDIMVMMDLHTKLNRLPKEMVEQGQTRATTSTPTQSPPHKVMPLSPPKKDQELWENEKWTRDHSRNKFRWYVMKKVMWRGCCAMDLDISGGWWMGDVMNELMIGAWMMGFIGPIPYGCYTVSKVWNDGSGAMGVCIQLSVVLATGWCQIWMDGLHGCDQLCHQLRLPQGFCELD